VQYYALEKECRILSIDAKKGILYHCPECRGKIRLRSGPHRQPHFYHLKRDLACRQHQKSLTHLQIQNIVSSLLPDFEAVLEQPFPEIHRIADVAWLPQNIIFEIQCSPISIEEAKQRCEDYESLGLLPIWILHDKRYNRRKLSAAEHFLRTKHCFFTNIDETGRGEFYDQDDYCQGYRRLFKGKKNRIDLRNPLTPSKKTIPQRPLKKWTLLRLYKIFLRLALESV
jgi:competence protein CoiA